jgi:hypothetical protein
LALIRRVHPTDSIKNQLEKGVDRALLIAQKAAKGLAYYRQVADLKTLVSGG